MKKAVVIICVILLIVPLSACNGLKSDGMYIETAQLTEKEQDMADLLGVNTEYQIYEFNLDDTVKSMQVNTYELVDGEWNLLFGGGGQEFTDTKGRIALQFEKIADGVRTTIQSKHNSSSVSYENESKNDFADMGCATSALNDRKEITYDQEIPLAIQIVTSKSEINSYNVDYFSKPLEYGKDGYEHVYAITVCFSPQTISSKETSQSTEGKTVSPDEVGEKENAGTRHIEQTLSSGVKVNADVKCPANVKLDELTEFTAHMRIQDYENAKQLLMDRNRIIDETENNKESMEDFPYHIIATSGDYTLSSLRTDINLVSILGEEIDLVFKEEGVEENGTKFLTNTNLEFQSIEAAQEEIQEMLNKLGIPVIQPPICYTMDGEPDGGAYLFVYQTSAKGMPISTYENGILDDGSYRNGTAVRVIYSKEGIVKFELDHQFEIDDRSGPEKGLQMEQILEKLDEKYQSITMEGEYSVDSIEFEYVPVPLGDGSDKDTLVPAWRMLVTHKYDASGKEKPDDKATEGQQSYVVFHAITGEEIPTGMAIQENK